MTTNDEFAPGDLAQLDRDARRIIGKSVGDCTIADLIQIMDVCGAEAARMQAEVDQAQMVGREASQCGCTIRIPIRPDGTQDLGRAVVNHVCGKASL